jgi:hypothetical protein
VHSAPPRTSSRASAQERNSRIANCVIGRDECKGKRTCVSAASFLDGPSARLLPLWSGLTCRKFPTYQIKLAALPTRGPFRTGKSVRRRIFEFLEAGPPFAVSRVTAGGACRPRSRTGAHLRCNHHPMTQLTALWPAPEPRERMTASRRFEREAGCRRGSAERPFERRSGVRRERTVDSGRRCEMPSGGSIPLSCGSRRCPPPGHRPRRCG